jgi:hypothetical protein
MVASLPNSDGGFRTTLLRWYGRVEKAEEKAEEGILRRTIL